MTTQPKKLKEILSDLFQAGINYSLQTTMNPQKDIDSALAEIRKLIPEKKTVDIHEDDMETFGYNQAIEEMKARVE